MPLIHKRTFRVRSYECDFNGHVNHANYLRYMQEAALDASAAVGYDEARYNALGHIWLIRETNIEYLHPLRFGDSVEVTTWVGDFRRVRSRRFYELRNTRKRRTGGERIDRLGLHRARKWAPARVPPEMVAAFSPEGTPEEAERRDPFPAAPPPPPGVFTMRRDGRVARHRHGAARQQRDLPELHGGMRDSGGAVVRLVDRADAERRLRDCRAQAPHRVSPAGSAGR